MAKNLAVKHVCVESVFSDLFAAQPVCDMVKLSFGGGEVVLRRTRPQMGHSQSPSKPPRYFLPGQGRIQGGPEDPAPYFGKVNLILYIVYNV